MSNLILIGFMGSGKSTVGALLGKKLSLPVTELDDEILIKSGFCDIKTLFDVKGEQFFRSLESNLLQKVLQGQRRIISTGGGIVEMPENLLLLKKAELVVYLDVSFETIVARLKNCSSRPLFEDRRQAFALYEKRRSLYTLCSDIIIDAASPVNDVVCLIAAGYRSLSVR